MIIKIESYLGDTLISGKVSSIGQVRSRMHLILEEVNERDFVAVYCARYKFDIIPYDDSIITDICIDLDTHKVF